MIDVAPPAPVVVAVPAVPPVYAVVKQLDLTAAMHLPAPWKATIEAAAGAGAQTIPFPVRICFTGPAPAASHCEPIIISGQPFPTSVDAKIVVLSETKSISALVVRASRAVGDHSSTATTDWVYAGPGVGFLNSFTTTTSDLGEVDALVSGPLAGDYVVADFVASQREGFQWADPHHFSIRVYQPNSSYEGYVVALQYITSRIYPAQRDAAHRIVDAETPTIVRLLHDLYPNGPAL